MEETNLIDLQTQSLPPVPAPDSSDKDLSEEMFFEDIPLKPVRLNWFQKTLLISTALMNVLLLVSLYVPFLGINSGNSYREYSLNALVHLKSFQQENIVPILFFLGAAGIICALIPLFHKFKRPWIFMFIQFLMAFSALIQWSVLVMNIHSAAAAEWLSEAFTYVLSFTIHKINPAAFSRLTGYDLMSKTIWVLIFISLILMVTCAVSKKSEE